MPRKYTNCEFWRLGMVLLCGPAATVQNLAHLWRRAAPERPVSTFEPVDCRGKRGGGSGGAPRCGVRIQP
jgi:hypothetical protein